MYLMYERELFLKLCFQLQNNINFLNIYSYFTRLNTLLRFFLIDDHFCLQKLSYRLKFLRFETFFESLLSKISFIDFQDVSKKYLLNKYCG